jgi:hypothetical protein
MARTTWWMTILASALVAAPLAAQDSVAAVKRDTTKRAAAPAVAPTPAPAPAPAPGSDSSNAIRPGMSQADVIAHWGQPVAVRRMNDWTYLFYRNGDERHWGYYDTVFLQNGQVMDAIVRSPDHVYAGQSSSPEGREVTPPRRPAPDSGRAAVTGVRVQPGR